jgi:hypothetical protein
MDASPALKRGASDCRPLKRAREWDRCTYHALTRTAKTSSALRAAIRCPWLKWPDLKFWQRPHICQRKADMGHGICGPPAGGCNTKGQCIVPSNDAHCIDPGGRCGCDGRPVDIFCGVGSTSEFTSAPVNAVGRCPRPCTADSDCVSGLLCRKGYCAKP